jgi:hypothetical protein
MSAEEAVATIQSAFMYAWFAGGRAACEGLLASDFTALRPDSAHTVQVVLRDQWLSEMDDHALEHPKITDTVISAHGDVAVATVPGPRALTPMWLTGAKRMSGRVPSTRGGSCQSGMLPGATPESSARDGLLFRGSLFAHRAR